MATRVPAGRLDRPVGSNAFKGVAPFLGEGGRFSLGTPVFGMGIVSGQPVKGAGILGGGVDIFGSIFSIYLAGKPPMVERGARKFGAAEITRTPPPTPGEAQRLVKAGITVTGRV